MGFGANNKYKGVKFVAGKYLALLEFIELSFSSLSLSLSLSVFFEDEGLVRSFENSDSLNNIPLYIGIVSEGVRRILPKWQTLIDFHLSGFRRSLWFFKYRKIIPPLSIRRPFKPLRSPQTYLLIYLVPPSVLTNQFAPPSHNRQGIQSPPPPQILQRQED